MTNAEMKEAFGKMGVSAEDTERVMAKYDAEKITELVEATSNLEEAYEKIHDFYPELEVEKLQQQMDFIYQQLESAVKGHLKQKKVELSKEELENIAGGGFWSDVGSWFKNNWKAILVGAAFVVGAALIGTGIGAAIGSTIVELADIGATGLTVFTPMTATGAGVGSLVGYFSGLQATGFLAFAGILSKVN